MSKNELFHEFADCIEKALSHYGYTRYLCAASFLKDAEKMAYNYHCKEITTKLRLIIGVLESDTPDDAMIHLTTFSKTLQDLKLFLDQEEN